jgi:ABC-type protease/lipase transport system fused ATPase/permease subunit
MLSASAESAATVLAQVRADVRPAIRKALAYGLLANLLMFTPTVYMLEVYDRVINSASLSTLVSLSVLTFGAFALLAVVDWVRGEILYQAQAAYSFSYNPSPLTLGAIAYLILFIPLVWLGRWVETRLAWKR